MTMDAHGELSCKTLVALRHVLMRLPHLSGLAAQVRIALDRRIETACVCPSGRVLIGPEFVASLEVHELAFVIAHELLHLALGTHARASRDDARLFNIAHDYIINDMLRVVFDCDPPAGGLDMEGARHLSAERIVAEMKAALQETPAHAGFLPMGTGSRRAAATTLGTALRDAGLLADTPEDAGEARVVDDVLSEADEARLFPDADRTELERRTGEVLCAAERTAEVAAVIEAAERSFGRGTEPGRSRQWVETLRSRHTAPWEMAVQRWVDANFSAERTYARPSRRNGDRADVIRPGRRRQGLRLHVVLDTSGSMWGEFPVVLGALAVFCESAGVESVRVLQCDVGVHVDEVLAPAGLARFRVEGGGGSDMRPAMDLLADDPTVEPVVVLTDGMIEVPETPPPYAVLWAVVGGCGGFQPPYGTLALIPPRDRT